MKAANLLSNDEFSQLPTTKLLEILGNGLLLERGRALFILAQRSGDHRELIDTVVKAIEDAQNKNAKTIGIVSISFLGITGMLTADNKETKEIAQKIIESWTETDRSNLVLFLNSINQDFSSLADKLIIVGR